jgi:hypothetical protein
MNCLRAEDGDNIFSPKRWYLPTSLYGVTAEKNIAILSAV